MDYLEKARRVISLEMEELERLLNRVDAAFVAAVETLKTTVEQGSKVIIVGVGKSGNVGNKLAATLNSTGAAATVLNCQDALHGDLGLVNEGDSIIALSYSGETAELLTLLPHLKRRHIQLIAITGKPQSTLGKAADCVIDIHVEREACPLNLAPTSSTTNTLVIGDALAMVLMEARGLTKENFAEFHPGGSLGRSLLLRASDIMRTGDDFVLVNPDMPVIEVVSRMTGSRAGAVVIIDSLGKLAGVFTQGDLAREFQSGDPEFGKKPVCEVMTKNPIHVTSDKLVGEVLRILEDHRIDDLVVIDDEGLPCGMIDTQDLTRVQIV